VRRARAVLASLLLGLPLAVWSGAAPAAGEAPRTLSLEGGTLTVTSDEMSFSNQTGVLAFAGNVKVDRSGMKMEARHLTVTLERDDAGTDKRRIDRMVAEGDVVFTYGDRTATAGRAEYDPAAGTVVLTEKPQVSEPTMTVQGKRITIDLETQESTVEGGAFTFTEGP
jgi:lipopolysaccharide transport protein LptA